MYRDRGRDRWVRRRSCARWCSSTGPALAVRGALVALALLPALAHSQTIHKSWWVPNGPVNAVARSGNTIYIGGSFTTVGPPTGSGVPVSATTAAPIEPYPRVAGVVFAAIADGDGGWFIGGRFTAVGEQPRENLAHILADGSVGPWAPSSEGTVQGLVRHGAQVFLFGQLGHVNGQPRHYLASVDATTGVLTSWDPNTDSDVYSIVGGGGAIYMLGYFGQAGGQPRVQFAAVDTLDGLATSWNPVHDGYVYSFASDDSAFYLGGNFTTIDGQARNGLAAFDLDTGAITGWDPHPDVADIFTLAAGRGVVCAAGNFASIGGQARDQFATLDASSGNATPLNPGNLFAGSQLIATDGTRVFEIGTGLVADAWTGAISAWDPKTSGGAVRCLAIEGDAVFIGGDFATIGGLPRHCLAALDATTGEPTPFDAHIDATGQDGVRALAVHGDLLYVAGGFVSVAGQPDSLLAGVDLVTGELRARHQFSLFGGIYALALVGDTLYTGGSFTRVDGTPRRNIAAIDLTTETLTPWQAAAIPIVWTLAADRERVFLGGQQTVAALDAGTAAEDWRVPGNDYVRALARHGPALYAGGGFSTLGGQIRSGLAALDASTGAVLAWNPSTNSRVNALAVRDGLVHVGGGPLEMGGQARSGLATLHESTGLPVAWDMGFETDLRDRLDGSGSFQGRVLSLFVTADELVAGGDFTCAMAWPAIGIAAFVIDAATPTQISLVSASADGGRVRVEWYSAGDMAWATVYRRTPDSEWAPVGAIARGGSGRFVYEDSDVLAGVRYGYALGIDVDGSEQRLGETWIDVPLTRRLALAGATPNPASAGPSIAFSLPDASPARLEVLDVAGRVVLERAVGSLGPGDHLVRLTSGPALSPGLYFLRLSSGSRSAISRMVIVR